MARIPKLDSAGRFLAADVNAQIDARTKATMRADLPALAEELKLVGGGGVEQVSGTVSLDASGPPIREFFTTGATTFKANGADTLISSFTAVVWRRNAQGSWGYQVVQDGWVTPAATPDTTAPVAGTLAVTVTDVKADLSVSGASDDRGYVQYSFSKDNGATWTAYQDSATYTFTGLAASTSYQFRHRVKDAAGNTTTGTAVSKSTAATPPPPPHPYIQAAQGMGLQHIYALDGTSASTTNRGTATTPTPRMAGPVYGTGIGGFAQSMTAGSLFLDNMLPAGAPAYTVAVVWKAPADISTYKETFGDWSGKNRVRAASVASWWVEGPTSGGPVGTAKAVASTVYHVALTWDGSTASLYVDGTLVGSRADAGPVATSAAFAFRSEFSLGLSGAILDTTKALTAAQVKQLSDAVVR